MLKARIITAVCLLAGLLGALFLLPVPLWLTLCTLVCAGAAWEWGGLSGFTQNGRIAFSAMTALMCGMLGVAAGLDTGTLRVEILQGSYLVSAVFWLVVVPFWLRSKWRLLVSPVFAVCSGWIVLVPPVLALAHLRLLHPSPWLLLAALAIVWVADITAYFAGRALGRHKLAPQISPGKTWEGAAGGGIGVCILGFSIFFLSRDYSHFSVIVPLALFPVLIGWTAVSIMGDLFESLLKRQAGVKDSGALLPGHGGILDRIDSLTSTLPLVGLAALWLIS